MIEPFESDGKWLLARGVEYVASQGISGTRGASPRGRRTFHDCWSEERGWVTSAGLATQFDTKEDAQQYLFENQKELDMS